MRETPQPIRPQDIAVSPETLALIAREDAVHLKICPLGLKRVANDVPTLAVAAVEATNPALRDQLQRKIGCRVSLLPATEQDIMAGIIKHYGQPPEVTAPTDLLSQMSARVISDDGSEVQPPTQNAKIMVEDIIQRAVHERATDIHLQPQPKQIIVRFRVDGTLFDQSNYEQIYHSQVVSRVKILANLDIAQTRLPQDGRFDVAVGNHIFDVRVSVAPIAAGEKVVLRLLPKMPARQNLVQLGFLESAQTLIEEMIAKPYGMVLATGPTGSGKTTTLYALLSRQDCVGKNVLTIEDPIEYQLPHVSQIQVNPRIGLTFATGLRSMLRQDPDVIMVGEIRDAETLEIAVQAALTGHLVLSTMHCNDAAAAAARMVDMGEEPYLIASSVTCIVAQRLVRKVCSHCAAMLPIAPDIHQRLGLPSDFTIANYGSGCAQCRGTGYLGRTGVSEVVPMTDGIRAAIMAKASAADIRRIIRDAGIPTLFDAGIEKLRTGITSLDEFMRAVFVEVMYE